MDEVRGWVCEKRVVGGIVFLEVVTGLDLTPVTVVAKKRESPDAWRAARKVRTGSAVLARGVFKKEAVSRKGRELGLEELVVLAEPLVEKPPVDYSGKTGVLLDTSIEYRYLTLRLPRWRAIYRIRAEVVEAARRFFRSRGFLEVHTPKICGAGAEGGATLFTIDYFGRKAFLAQSPQLYKQMLMAGVPRVFEITPYFRAEKFSTVRHLNESWGVDAEIGFIDGVDDVLRVLEEFIVYVYGHVKKSCRGELEALRVRLEVPRAPFRRLDYGEALEILRGEGYGLKWGDDLGADEEAVLGRVLREEGCSFYFIVGYPWEAKPFYIMRDGDASRAFDLDCEGMELASGGQREHRYGELVKNIEEKGLSPEGFGFYLEAFRHGMPPHGGFGLGLDRLLMKMLGLSNIREVVLFPRDRQRLVP